MKKLKNLKKKLFKNIYTPNTSSAFELIDSKKTKTDLKLNL